MRQPSALASIGMLLVSTLFVAAAGADLHAGQPAAQIRRDVERALGAERDLRPIEVSVTGSEVTLLGRVPTFWAKSQAIKKTLEVEGVETVVSELAVPAVEDDTELGQQVVDAVLAYPYYTMWDYISVFVNRGVITLTGSVTPDLDKSPALIERVAKVPGVQDVRNTMRSCLYRRQTRTCGPPSRSGSSATTSSCRTRPGPRRRFISSFGGAP